MQPETLARIPPTVGLAPAVLGLAGGADGEQVGRVERVDVGRAAGAFSSPTFFGFAGRRRAALSVRV